MKPCRHYPKSSRRLPYQGSATGNRLYIGACTYEQKCGACEAVKTIHENGGRYEIGEWVVSEPTHYYAVEDYVEGDGYYDEFD